MGLYGGRDGRAYGLDRRRMESGPASFADDLRALRGHRSHQEPAAASDLSVADPRGPIGCTGKLYPDGTGV